MEIVFFFCAVLLMFANSKRKRFPYTRGGNPQGPEGGRAMTEPSDHRLIRAGEPSDRELIKAYDLAVRKSHRSMPETMAALNRARCELEKRFDELREKLSSCAGTTSM